MYDFSVMILGKLTRHPSKLLTDIQYREARVDLNEGMIWQMLCVQYNL